MYDWHWHVPMFMGRELFRLSPLFVAPIFGEEPSIFGEEPSIFGEEPFYFGGSSFSLKVQKKLMVSHEPYFFAGGQ